MAKGKRPAGKPIGRGGSPAVFTRKVPGTGTVTRGPEGADRRAERSAAVHGDVIGSGPVEVHEYDEGDDE